jgi:FlaA1/EpsC-like NDP-sugar epimerase
MLGLIYFFGAVSSRIAAQLALRALRAGNAASVPVAVYGAGSAGIQLVTALRRSSEVNPVVFVDDNRSLWGMLVSGIKVERPARLAGLVAEGRVGKVLIAMPSVPSERVSAIVAAIEPLGCEIQILPSYVDMISGAAIEQALIPVSHDALLGRDMVDLNTQEIEQSYAGRVVMVTGAGGSIGSELCRQLLECHPSRIVLFERSEFALYQVNEDLRAASTARRIGLSVRLGSVTDAARVAEVIAQEGVEIILHAAAYKHVPIVEENEIEGARNNILGTRTVAKAAQVAGVERFILISTDKAVRPTSVMGATKRMAELVLQDLQTRPGTTIFSMVRFGNVLGSSGSVLPLFERQIRAGGPLTVTHPEVTRFFMTIPEASRLVLLAGTYARGGDVFVLDMGEPIRILDVARRMITLSGRKPVLDALANEDGAIGICFTGLRPGEKLFEELLIDGDTLRETPHGKIMRAEEARLSRSDMEATLGELRAILDRADSDALRALLARRVQGFAARQEAAKLAS